ncbi:MAG: TVP38/TMEM64 family protein [Limisphaerales bacterium]
MAPTSPPVTPASRKALPRIGLAILLAVLATILLLPHINTLLIQSLDRIQHQGPLAAAAFSLLCITSIVLLVPPSPLKLSAGALFGFAIGAPLAWLSVILGSTLAFLLSRYFGRNRIEKKIQSTPTLHAVDQAITQSGWRIVLLARLCPVLPCPILNYAFGASNITLLHYVSATALGTLPSAILYSWIGSAVGSLSGLHQSPGLPTPWNWILYSIGIIAGIMLTTHLTKTAQQMLKKHLPNTPNNP